MKKRSFSLALVFALCLNLLPAVAAEGTETDPVTAAREAGVLTYFDETFSPELTETVTYYDVAKVLAGVADYEIDLSQVEESQWDEAISNAVKGILMSFTGSGLCRRERVALDFCMTLEYRVKQVLTQTVIRDTFLKNIDMTKQFPDIDSSGYSGEKATKLYNMGIITPGDEEGNFLPDTYATWQDLLIWAAAAKIWATTSPDSQENLPPLTGVPTDLQWGVYRRKKPDGTVATEQIAGYCSAKMENDSGHQNWFEFTLYRQGETEPVGGPCRIHYKESSDTTYVNDNGHYLVSETTAAYENAEDWKRDRFIDSGSYYFTVKAIGDGIKYRNGDESQPSTIFEYQKPDERLAPPVKLWWDGKKMKVEDSQIGVYGYYVDILFSETETADISNMKKTYGGWLLMPETLREEGIEPPEETIQEYGTGYYYFHVYVLSADINQWQGSDWSELSPAYHLTDIPTKDSLGEILNSAEGKTPEEIRSAVQELNTGDLKTALLADQNEAGGTAELLEQLEGKMGITVNTAGETPDFADMAAGTKIVGAALNDVPEGTDTITLNIGQPEKDHVIPEQYHNAVALRFGMGLEGVVDQENLKVPVRITLPIPTNINPQFLVLLHYGQDGKVEEITHPKVYTFQQEGKWYASFVLTHFSDFILTELKQAEPDPTPTPTPDRPSGGGSSGGGGGGSSAPTTYAIAVPKADHGAVTLSPQRAQRGEKVTVTLTPDKGYVADSLTVLDGKGKAVEVTEAGEGKYTFTMPGSKVEVKAIFKEIPAPAPTESPAPTVPVTERFRDIRPGDWYVAGVQYVCDKGLMEGMEEDRFAPEAPLTRGALVTILHRLEGSPACMGRSFRDVPGGQWYANGVVWAASRGLVNGFEDGTFRPEEPVTREQLVTILYRYTAGKERVTTARADLSGFTDARQISSYARDSLAWAKAAGLVSGMDWGGIDPQGRATRAQVAAILQRFCEKMK